MNNVELLPMKEAARRIGVSRTWIYHRLNEGPDAFPAPVRIGPKRVAFVSSEIDAFIASLIAKRDGGVQDAA